MAGRCARPYRHILSSRQGTSPPDTRTTNFERNLRVAWLVVPQGSWWSGTICTRSRSPPMRGRAPSARAGSFSSSMRGVQRPPADWPLQQAPRSRPRERDGRRNDQGTGERLCCFEQQVCHIFRGGTVRIGTKAVSGMPPPRCYRCKSETHRFLPLSHYRMGKSDYPRPSSGAPIAHGHAMRLEVARKKRRQASTR